MKYRKKEEVDHVQNYGDILACKYYHSSLYINGTEAIGDCGSKDIDGKKWDVFHISYETEDAYYGIPMLGMGLMNCMILKTDTRPFQDGELGHYRLGMFGSHSNNYSRDCSLDIQPITEKIEVNK